MSVLSVLVFITHGTSLRRGWPKKPPDDATLLELFSRILMGEEKCPSKLSAVLEKGIEFPWQDVEDFVNPFGDSRGGAFESVWTFDLDKDVLLLTKKDRFCSTPLERARERLLNLDDFELQTPPRLPLPDEKTLPGPYWDLKMDPPPREKSFLGQILRDFVHAWRHVLRRQMNTTTFMRLAYATIWISTMDFDILERTGFEHISSGRPYVWLLNLPNWETPDDTLVQAGASWFVLTQDTKEGLEIVRRHMKSDLLLGKSTNNTATYVILTLRQVTLCKANGSQLMWTRSETLFDGGSASDSAIDMILWATKTTTTEPQPSRIHFLPTEIQNKILCHATTSFVASAKLGCELDLGTPFSWLDRGVKISVEGCKRHRGGSSPAESLIVFNGTMSGLSYKRELGDWPKHFRRRRAPSAGRTQSFAGWL
ncbi:hypothetical protein EDB81DRAFT_638173 [Dactylonectria macrodidyma]|uniref:Uncharacterized protein n=1 Tax=Dactylonectria macrodidyma TaxID=307937 RepID=A0A9P9FRH3_9HYPO|nr:hypothetical protein EDB81DRAFT_638173 [Dactylonectria macrodidyma]